MSGSRFLTPPRPSRRDVLRFGAQAAMFATIASQVDFTRPAYAGDTKLTGPLKCWRGPAITTRS